MLRLLLHLLTDNRPTDDTDAGIREYAVVLVLILFVVLVIAIRRG